MLAVAATNEQLPVQGARAGEPEAWDTLFRRYQLPLYTYVFELLHHEQTSLDVVQETFISATRHIGGLREDGKVGSWLFSIAHQKCVQLWRRSRCAEELPEDAAEDFPDAAASPSEALIRKEDEEKFMCLLNELPPPHRSVLLLHFIEDFSLEEIATITGTKIGTVKSRLHYAKRALRKRIEGQE